MDLASIIRDVPDFPKPGILFKDITPLLRSPEALQATIDRMAALCQGKKIDLIAGIESRGFIFGAPLACQLNLGFIPVRKPGKLPAETVSQNYALEYGTNTLEMHVDSVEKGQQVLIIDDLLATGGTALATCKLIEQLGGNVAGLIFAVELSFLKGREVCAGYEIEAVVTFD